MSTSTPPSDAYGTGSSAPDGAPSPAPYGTPPTGLHGDPAPWQQGAGAGQGPGGLAVAALVVGIVAFLLGLVPFLGLLAGAAAVVLGIVVLRRGRHGAGAGTARTFGLVGVIGGGLAVLAGLVTTVLFAIGLAGLGGLSSGDTNTDTGTAAPAPSASRPAAPSSPSPSASASSPSTPSEPEPVTGGPGEAVTAADGVAFTVTDLTCGLATVGQGEQSATAQGQFCVVDVSLTNGSKVPTRLTPSGVTAYADDVEFASDLYGNTYANTLEDLDPINPGQSQAGRVVFDVPEDVILDRVVLTTTDYDDPGVSISLS